MAEIFHELDDAQLASMRALKFGDWDAFEFEKIQGTRQKLDYLYQCIQDAAVDREFYLRKLREAEQLPEMQEFDAATTKYNQLSDRIEEITTKFSDLLPDGVWHDWVFTRPYNECHDPDLARIAYEETEAGYLHDDEKTEWELLKAEAEELKSLYKVRETYADIAIDPPSITEGDGLVHHLAFQEWSKSNKLVANLQEKYTELVHQLEDENRASVDGVVDVIGVSSTTDTGDGEPTENKIDHVQAANDMWEAQRQLDIEKGIEEAQKPDYREKLANEEWLRTSDEVNLGRLALNKNLREGNLIGQVMRLRIKDIHASEMLAFRGGIVARFSVTVQFTARHDPNSNQVEVRFINNKGRPYGKKSAVTIIIEPQDHAQKLKISTCMSINPYWPHYENNVEGVPAGLSQIKHTKAARGNVRKHLEKYLEYHNLVVAEMVNNNQA